MEFLIFGAAMAAGFGLSKGGLDGIAGIVMIAAALVLYACFYRKSGRLTNPAALFSLSWIGGAGVSALKLSRLQTVWDPVTWCVIALTWLFFIAGFCAPRLWRKRRERRAGRVVREASEEFPLGQDVPSASLSVRARRLFRWILAITLISAACFVFEACWLGYIPLFTEDTPHAYSYFHISGVHYFTVSCVLVPALFVLYAETLRRFAAGLNEGQKHLFGGELVKKLFSLGYGGQLIAAFLLTALSLCVPVLCVSRFQLVFAVFLAGFAMLAVNERTNLKKLLPYAAALLLCLVPVYVGLTVARAHDVSYLNGIFEMKYEHMPIFITQPYMYIANNYDNLNCLVTELPKGGHTMGLRMLFPLWAFTGLKFLVPSLTSAPLYVTKEELTTVTLIYDAYYDFGLTGAALLAFVLGSFSEVLFQKVRSRSFLHTNPAFYLVSAELSFYLLFSFFTTWFSNPTTWFYFAVSALIYLLCRREES